MHSNHTDKLFSDVHPEGKLSRRQTLLRAGLALSMLPILGALSACQTRGGYRPLTEDQKRALWGDTPPSRTAANDTTGSGYFALPAGVMARSQWTRSPVITSRVDPMVRVERITVHHDAIYSGDVRSLRDSVQRLEAVRSGHVERQWADIGYHFIIDPLGTIWEGRPLQYQGAHASDNNPRNMGVMLMGNFEEQRPTLAAMSSLDRLLTLQMGRYNVPLSRVHTHREIGVTLCPGRNLQVHMADARSVRGVLTRA